MIVKLLQRWIIFTMKYPKRQFSKNVLVQTKVRLGRLNTSLDNKTILKGISCYIVNVLQVTTKLQALFDRDADCVSPDSFDASAVLPGRQKKGKKRLTALKMKDVGTQH